MEATRLLVERRVEWLISSVRSTTLFNCKDFMCDGAVSNDTFIHRTCCRWRILALYTCWKTRKLMVSVRQMTLYFDITHTHICLTALCPGLPRWAGTRKAKPIWILLKQETVSGSGINWAICKSAPRSRQITMSAPHRSVFYRPDALPAAQPTASKDWMYFDITVEKIHTGHKRACSRSFFMLTQCYVTCLHVSGMHWWVCSQ